MSASDRTGSPLQDGAISWGPLASQSTTLVVGRACHPSLLAAVHEASSRAKGDVLLLTDDRDLLPTRDLPHGVVVVEPEELLSEGVEPVEDAWDAGMQRWLARLFPGTLEGLPLAELLWVNVCLQPTIIHRISAVALARELFRRCPSIGTVVMVGEPPPYCATVAATAQHRRLRVVEENALDPGLAAEPAALLLASLAEGVRESRWPRGVALSLGLLARNAVRAVERTVGRKRILRRLQAVLPGSIPGSTDAVEPRLWAVAPPRWPQASRQILEGVATPCERAEIPYGLAFEITFGEGREGAAPDGTPLDEAALFDGTAAQHRPAMIDQVAGATTVLETAALLAAWLPRATVSCLRAIRHVGALRVSEIPLSDAGDLQGLLRVCTNDLLRVVDAAQATRRFVRRHPSARVAVFGLSSAGEAKVSDLLMQRAGITTVDYLHCFIGEGALRTEFRSCNRVLATWTYEEAERFRRTGTNDRCVGGYLPRPMVPVRALRDPLEAGHRNGAARSVRKTRLLVATNYLHPAETLRLKYGKFARRMAVALAEVVAHFGDRLEVILRPHPVEDREAWRALLDEAMLRQAGPSKNPLAPPRLSEVGDLGSDLAQADLAIVTNSSVIIEALRYRIPLFFQKGPVIEPSSLLGKVAPSRRFASGAELVAAVELALADPQALAPEDALVRACFGEGGEPRPLLSLLRELDPELDAAGPQTLRHTGT